MRPTATGMAVVAVLVAVAAGCGGGGDGQPAESVPDQEAAFCDAWTALGPVPGVNDAEAAGAWADGIQQLLAVAPSRHRPAVEQMTRTATTFVELGERAGWTGEGFAELSERQQQQMAGQADDLAQFFTGPVAVYAHEVCPDADDPAFELACPGLLAFVTGGGQQGGGILTEGADPGAAPVADPLAAAEEALSSMPGAVEVRSSESGDTTLITYLGDDGRSVRIDELHDDGAGWVVVTSRSCRS